jgi:5-formyltetrahydrofolate cyclo-ligase
VNAGALQQAKATLRARMRAVRDAIGADERARRSELIARRLLELPVMSRPRTTFLFYSFGSEAATGELVALLSARGHRILLPVTRGPDMHASAYRPGEALVPTGYGAKEPVNDTPVPPGEIEVVVAPGLAFDRRGYRLGYGAGYYDRFLALLPPSTPRIGIGFDEQLVEDVPHGPGDERLHLVVTDRETVDCRES